MARSDGIEALKGSWDHVDEENFDEVLKEMGLGWATRLTAKAVKPRVIISENEGVWTVKSEAILKSLSFEFKPGVPFDETTPDGREVKNTTTFEGNKYVSRMVDKKTGQKTMITRYVDDKDQQIMEMECGSVKARRRYKRII